MGFGGPTDIPGAIDLYLRGLEHRGEVAVAGFRDKAERHRPVVHMTVQRFLSERGHFAGAIDGHFGPDSQAALARWAAAAKPN